MKSTYGMDVLAAAVAVAVHLHTAAAFTVSITPIVHGAPSSSSSRIFHKSSRNKNDYEDFLEQKRREDVVRKGSLFDTLGKGDMARLVAVMESVSDMPVGEPVVKQGDKGNSMYFVDEGTFECYDEQTGEVVRVCHPGDYFGELSLLYDSPRAVSVRPTTDNAKLWMIAKEDFESSVKKSIAEKVAAKDPGYAKYFEDREKRETLKKSILFKKLLPDDIERIIQGMRRIDVLPGELIVKQGDEGESMFFVREGEFECYDELTGRVLAVCTAGDAFGELAILLDQKRALSVRAAENSTTATLWELDKEDFVKNVQDSPVFESILETIQVQYQVDNALSLLQKLNPKELYDLAVTVSRPKKSPVSLHSTLATIATGLLCVPLIETFSPGFYIDGWPRFFNARLYTGGDLAVRTTALLFTIVAVLGIFRLPPNTPRIRRLLFTQCTVNTVAQYITLDSNAVLHGGIVPTFDLMTWNPGSVFFWVIFAWANLLVLELAAEAIGAPERGRLTVPLWGSPVGVWMLATLTLLGNVLNLPPPVISQDYDGLVNVWLPFVDSTAGPLIYLSTIGMMGMGMLVATLMFEEKIPQERGVFWFAMAFLLTGFYDFLGGSVFGQLSLPPFQDFLQYQRAFGSQFPTYQIALGILSVFTARGFYMRFTDENRQREP